mmetsp:Transcript_34394/g.95098  ORF Transcript_34394/g.95098 Transcript_34394/m.95098 type:complete len:428 (-) Transcript_34394:18-1301(-)
MKFQMLVQSSSPSITCSPASSERRAHVLAGSQTLAGVRVGTGVIGLLQLARLGLSLGSSTLEQPLSQCLQRRRGKGCCSATPVSVSSEVSRAEPCCVMADICRQGSKVTECPDGALSVGECALAGDWKRARARLEEMWRRGLVPDAAMYETAIMACAQTYQWVPALQLLRQMCERGVGPSLGAYNAALLVLARTRTKRGSEWALALFQEMEARGLQPDEVTFQHVIAACVRGYRWSWAVRLLFEMEHRGLQPGLALCNKVLQCCARQQQWQTVVRLFESMEASGLELDAEAYEIAARACGQGGQWRHAAELLAEGRRQGCLPRDTAAYSATIDACGQESQWAQAVDLLAGMERHGVEPDQFVYAAAMRACKAGEQQELADGVAGRRAAAQEAAAAAAAAAGPDEAAWLPARPPPPSAETLRRLEWGL